MPAARRCRSKLPKARACRRLPPRARSRQGPEMPQMRCWPLGVCSSYAGHRLIDVLRCLDAIRRRSRRFRVALIGTTAEETGSAAPTASCPTGPPLRIRPRLAGAGSTVSVLGSEAALRRACSSMPRRLTYHRNRSTGPPAGRVAVFAHGDRGSLLGLTTPPLDACDRRAVACCLAAVLRCQFGLWFAPVPETARSPMVAARVARFVIEDRRRRRAKRLWPHRR